MAARLDAIVLCDFAQVREGLLFVQSGGLTRLAAPSFPAQFSCHLALLVHVPPDQAADAHELVLKVKSAETATLVATVNVAMHESAVPPGMLPGEARLVPIVVPITAVVFPAPGEYDLHVEVDREFAGDISFRTELRPPPG